MCKTVLIEGSIGVGKSLFLSELEQSESHFCVKTKIINEPLNDWRNLTGFNLFELYNNDQKRWGFAFQSYVFLTMIKAHKIPLNKGQIYRVIERSLYSANKVFVENLLSLEILEPVDYEILNQWYDYLVSDELAFESYAIIYLKAPPEILIERIRLRNRSEESSINLKYLQNLEIIYESWIRSEIKKGTKVITIDTHKSETDTIKEFRDVICGVEAFL